MAFAGWLAKSDLVVDPTTPALYPVSVRRVRALPWVSLRPRLTATPLPLDLGLHAHSDAIPLRTAREDFHLQVLRRTWREKTRLEA